MEKYWYYKIVHSKNRVNYQLISYHFKLDKDQIKVHSKC